MDNRRKIFSYPKYIIGNRMFRSTKHSLEFANAGKIKALKEFIFEYRRVSSILIDCLWNNGFEWEGNDQIKHSFIPKEGKYDIPSFIPTNVYSSFISDTTLSGRVMKCLATQLAGMLSSAVEKQRKRLFMLEQKKADGVSKNRMKQLIHAIKTNIPQKPNAENINPELNSLCIEFISSNTKEFDEFMVLKSFTNTAQGKTISFPIKHHRHFNELMKKGTRLNSVLLSEDSVSIRFDIPDPEPKQNGIILGGDQGLKDVLNLANSDTHIVTQKVDNHGHSQESIINKVARKKKGSNAFRRAKEHQKNFINWSLNQLNLSDVKQINLEKIWNIGYRCSKSRKMSHWQNTLIRDKITKIALEQGVLVKEQSCTYRSQRCNSCGQVRKANRKGKMYECKNCGNVCDADMNAAINHSIVLPDVPWTLRNDKINRKNGFFWKPEGFFDYQGGSLQSPLPVNDNT